MTWWGSFPTTAIVTARSRPWSCPCRVCETAGPALASIGVRILRTPIGALTTFVRGGVQLRLTDSKAVTR